MKKRYVIKTIIICFFSITMVYGGFVATSYWQTTSSKSAPIFSFFNVRKAIASINTKSSVRVEIEIHDDTTTPSLVVDDVYFDKRKISLRPPVPSGNRGTTYLHVKPGKYTITWKVKTNKASYPNTFSHSKTIILTKDKKWSLIRIVGEEVTVI
jgi:hypothetical protein